MHPGQMPTDPVRRAVANWLARHLTADAPVVVACSGGADSLALALATVAVVNSAGGGRPLFAVTVDHGLQPGSAQRAVATSNLLAAMGFDQVRILAMPVA